MAIAQPSPLIHHLTGTVGPAVFRFSGGQQIVQALPSVTHPASGDALPYIAQWTVFTSLTTSLPISPGTAYFNPNPPRGLRLTPMTPANRARKSFMRRLRKRRMSRVIVGHANFTPASGLLLAATPFPGEVLLTWTHASPDPTNYALIFTRFEQAPVYQIHSHLTVPIPHQAFTLFGLQPGHQYEVHLHAYNPLTDQIDQGQRRLWTAI